jgi:hypothetical protein
MTTDRSGNLYMSGYFRGTPDFDPDPRHTYSGLTAVAGQDIFVSKISCDGKFRWAKGLNIDVLDNSERIVMSERFIYISGNVQGASNKSVIAKFDLTGAVLWVKQVNTTFSIFYCITVRPDDKLYIAGDIDRYSEFVAATGRPLHMSGHGDSNFVAELDENGNALWLKNFQSDAPADSFGEIRSIYYRDGYVYLTGRFTNRVDFDFSASRFFLAGVVDGDVFVMKLRENGSFVWAFPIRSPFEDMGSDITCDDHGNIFVTGFVVNSTDFDPDPRVASFGDWAGFKDVFIASYTNDGALRWQKTFGSRGDDKGVFVSVSDNSAIYTFSQNSSNVTIHSAGYPDIRLPYSLGTDVILTMSEDSDFEGGLIHCLPCPSFSSSSSSPDRPRLIRIIIIIVSLVLLVAAFMVIRSRRNRFSQRNIKR